MFVLLHSKLRKDMDKNSYALGMNIAHNMMQSGITRLQYEDFLSGL